MSLEARFVSASRRKKWERRRRERERDYPKIFYPLLLLFSVNLKTVAPRHAAAVPCQGRPAGFCVIIRLAPERKEEDRWREGRDAPKGGKRRKAGSPCALVSNREIPFPVFTPRVAAAQPTDLARVRFPKRVTEHRTLMLNINVD